MVSFTCRPLTFAPKVRKLSSFVQLTKETTPTPNSTLNDAKQAKLDHTQFGALSFRFWHDPEWVNAEGNCQYWGTFDVGQRQTCHHTACGLFAWCPVVDSWFPLRTTNNTTTAPNSLNSPFFFPKTISIFVRLNPHWNFLLDSAWSSTLMASCLSHAHFILTLSMSPFFELNVRIEWSQLYIYAFWILCMQIWSGDPFATMQVDMFRSMIHRTFPARSSHLTNGKPELVDAN